MTTIERLMDPAAGLALGSALCLAIALVLARVGLRGHGVIAAAATSVPTATALMWLAAPFVLDVSGFDWRAVGIFAACGALFPIGQTLLSFATNRLMGPALAGALSNTTPLFALGFAALLLGEPVTPGRAAGAAAIILGVVLLSLGGGGVRRDWPLWALGLPVLSAVIRGVVQPGVKLGLGFWHAPFAAALVGYTVSSAVILSLRAVVGAPSVTARERAMFMVVGVSNASAVMLMYAALARGAVGLVAPLVASYPLFTLALSAVFLRGERLHAQLMAGVGVTVGGVVLVLTG
ncbi:MAG: DMT family transporter [Alphaproteobacteria bacterium]|nr:DMT family transporter [Alphaproteobacteria bacterium]